MYSAFSTSTIVPSFQGEISESPVFAFGHIDFTKEVKMENLVPWAFRNSVAAPVSGLRGQKIALCCQNQ